ncbi:beta-lactamase-like protein [Mycena olivaceomarginata]|nr:beta-lactamase-like protein [Mycena olivaceomarginata]
MARSMTVTFLGTCSGGGPNESRNCSSLIVDCLRDGSLWMVDCAEGTIRQFDFQPRDTPVRLKPQSVSKLFITHMHADPHHGRIRTFVCSILKMTLTHTAEKYVAHELLCPEDTPTPCEPPEVMHSSELAGRDIRCSDDGFWRAFTQGRGALGDVVVDAGPILHRDPCLGYILREPVTPARKLRRMHTFHEKSVRGTNERRRLMAGEFAKTIGAEKLVLNHIGGRFPAPRRDRDTRMHVMREMERQATEAWGSGQDAVAAWDFMRVAIPAPDTETFPRQTSTKKRKRSHKI